jgi:hypothetical protein
VTRQRVHLRTPGWSMFVRLLTIVFALVLMYGGVLVALLATKALSPHAAEQISDYRRIYHDVAGLHPSDFTTAISFIAGFTGLLVFIMFAFLTFEALPRPYFARSEVALPDQPAGATVVRPRAVERVAEHAARSDPDVSDAHGRLSDDTLHVDVSVRNAPRAAATLAEVRRRVGEQLVQHEIPTVPVIVTLAGYERSTKEDLP